MFGRKCSVDWYHGASLRQPKRYKLDGILQDVVRVCHSWST